MDSKEKQNSSDNDAQKELVIVDNTVDNFDEVATESTTEDQNFINLSQNPEDTDKIIDDIADEDSTKLLQLQDQNSKPPVKEESKLQKIKSLIKKFYSNKKIFYPTVAAVVILFFATILIPSSRYFVMNTVGIRVQTSLLLTDDSLGKPIRGATVRIDGQSATTDDNGQVTLNNLRQGQQTIIIEKRSFAKYQQTITLGYGSNPLGTIKLTAVGTGYKFKVIDWLAEKPLADAEISIKDAGSGKSNESGEAEVKIDKTNIDTFTATIKLQDYRTETLEIDSNSPLEQTIKLVPERPIVFSSNRSGKYDLYRIDADGQNEKVILTSTGFENGTFGINLSPDGKYLAYSSTRDNLKNADGYILTNLYLISMETQTIQKVVDAEQIDILGWDQQKLIYARIVAGSSAGNPARMRIANYSTVDQTSEDLVSANLFNAYRFYNNKILYSLSSYGQSSSNNARLFSMDSDGQNKAQISSSEVYNIYTNGNNSIIFSSEDGSWYSYGLNGDQKPQKTSQPTSFGNIAYTTSPNAKNIAWIEQRDGIDNLILSNTDQANLSGKSLVAQSGLSQPISWLTNQNILYYIRNNTESAYYVVDTISQKSTKIVNSTYAPSTSFR